MRPILVMAYVLAKFLSAVSKVSQVISKYLFTTVSYHRFSSNANDIFIVSYPRSGTTMLQMILYQLTSATRRPWDEVTHISEEIPYFERMLSGVRGIQVNPDGRRIFKTHVRRRFLKRLKGRFIYVWRDIEDVAWSYFHFYASYHDYRGSYDSFIDLFLAGRVQAGPWTEHVSEWVGLNSPENVLVIRYEDLVEGTPSIVCQIADFCSIKASDALIAQTVAMSSFSSMKKNENKFDHATELLLENNIRSGSFIRVGRVRGGSKRGPPNRYAELRGEFERVVAHGLADD